MSLKKRLNDDVKSALKAREMKRVGVFRQILAAIKQIEVDTREELDEAGTLAVFDKMIKQRRESITQYSDAGRTDLVDQEKFEIDLISDYLPKALSESEIAAMIESAMAETGASSMKEMGKVMAILKPQIAGRGDLGAVSQQVKAMLSG
jgi:uncharacterized protein YqeY